MTKGDACIILEYLIALYPGWNVTPELSEVVIDTLAVEGLDVDDGKRLAREHAAKHAWPNVPGLTAAVRQAVNRKIVEQAAERAKAEAGADDPDRKSITGWAQWYRTEGRGEWERLPANVRRGLRWFFMINPQ